MTLEGFVVALRDKKYFHLPSFRYVFNCCHCCCCYNHLPPTLIEPPHASLSFSYLSERLCAHHQFKWLSLSTAFLKYLPESEKKTKRRRGKKSIIALWNIVYTFFPSSCQPISHTLLLPLELPPTIQQPEVIVGQTNEQHTNNNNKKGEISVAGEWMEKKNVSRSEFRLGSSQCYVWQSVRGWNGKRQLWTRNATDSRSKKL